MPLALAEVLERTGISSHIWRSPDGSRAIVLPHGGRVLGLFSSASDENFFWTTPALESVETAQSFFKSVAWHNSGGDRTWLAPEIEFFFPHYPETDLYLQPQQLDSTSYEFTKTTAGVVMVNKTSLRMHPLKEDVDVAIKKELAPAKSPLVGDSAHLQSHLEFAGYTLITTLTLTSDHQLPSVPIGLWNLLQLPHGGKMFICTYSRATPVPYMGSVASEDIEITDRSIRWHMAAKGEHKFGLCALHATGRTAYLYEGSGRQYSLVIRNCFVNPSGCYVDVPANGTQTVGCAIQACSIDSDLGKFSELEYHAPAIGGITGSLQRIDESQVWAFRGNRKAISEVMRLLVVPEI